ncbi:MAG: hypothetical protein WD628_01370, partial [Thermomicrobiales bacterium]
MRWLVKRGDTTADEPQLLTLNEASSDDVDAPGGLITLPGGALSITVRSASEARQTLAELQRVQQELLVARARAAGDSVASIGSTVRRTIQPPNRQLRRAAALAGRTARRLRPSAPVSRARQASSSVFDGLDAAILLAETAGGIDDALKLVGS